MPNLTLYKIIVEYFEFYQDIFNKMQEPAQALLGAVATGVGNSTIHVP